MLAGLSFYAWHAMSGGPPPHFLWTVIGAAAALAGLWLVLSPAPKKQIGSSFTLPIAGPQPETSDREHRRKQ